MGTNLMDDNNRRQPVREEVNVYMPHAQNVYYDTVLETVMTVHEVGDDFVTYVVEQEVDNIHSDPVDQFLAWLAAKRFIQIGERNQEGRLTT